MGTTASVQAENLEYADGCIEKGVAAREKRNLKAALRFFEEALRIRELVYGPSADVNYSEPYISVLIMIGEVHLWQANVERALYYLLRASELLDPKLDLPSIKRTTAVTQFVNVTAGLVLVLNKIALDSDWQQNHDAATLRAALNGTHPLDMAEAQLQRAIEVVYRIEGTRSSTLIPLFHMLARVYMSRRRVMNALRVMQRCLGLTLHVAQTKQIFSFLSYTRNVLDAIKKHAVLDSAALIIQQWFRERKSLNFQSEAKLGGGGSTAASSPTSARGAVGADGIERVPSSARRSNAGDDAAGVFTVPDILQVGHSAGDGGGNPCVSSSSPEGSEMRDNPLPGEIDEPMPDGAVAPLSGRDSQHAYSTLNHVTRRMTNTVWEVAPSDTEVIASEGHTTADALSPQHSLRKSARNPSSS